MDASYTFQGLDFEWDTRKASTNLRKHRISFEIACEVFLDPFVCVVEAGVIEGEPREAAIGMTEDWRLILSILCARKFYELFRPAQQPIWSENYMKVSKLKERLRPQRPMTTISIRIPEDVLNDLKMIAPQLGFSGYQPLIRAYIGQGLRADLAHLEAKPEIGHLIESLRKHGVEDEIIASAMAEIKEMAKAA